MNRTTIPYLLLLLLLLPFQAEAQRWKLQRYEVALGINGSISFMDIGDPAYGIRSFNMKGIRPGGTFMAQYKITEKFSAGLDLSYFMFGATEEPIRVAASTFMTHAFEHTARVEYTLLGGRSSFRSASIFNKRGMVNDFGSTYLYVFGGAGGILSRATAWDDADIELSEESDAYYNNREYGIVIPAGLGFKFSLSDHLVLGGEIGGRFTFTDKLDGYQTIWSNYNDRYIITTFKAIYKINNDRRGRPIFNKYGIR
jgi:hypothetical protein